MLSTTRGEIRRPRRPRRPGPPPGQSRRLAVARTAAFADRSRGAGAGPPPASRNPPDSAARTASRVATGAQSAAGPTVGHADAPPTQAPATGSKVLQAWNP